MGCEASTFPWTYSSQETAYVLKGLVFVRPEGGELVEIRAGDLCVFPRGMKCAWEVREAIEKHRIRFAS